MNGFLNELGKKAAERWLSMLILPGLVWTAAMLATAHLRHDKPTTVRPVIDAVTTWTARPHTTTELVIVLLELLLASTAASLAVTGLAVVVRHAWVVSGRRRPTQWLTTWRHRRWTARHQYAEDIAAQAAANKPHKSTQPPTVHAAGLAEALSRRDAISLEPPQRRTWIGDYWHATYTRVQRAHGLDLTVVWPRLWAVLPDNLRTDITTAHTAYTTSSILTAWALLYLIPTTLWWPTATITLFTFVIATIRARTATTTLCQLIETATDLHAHTLIQALHPPEPNLGHTITEQLRDQDRTSSSTPPAAE